MIKSTFLPTYRQFWTSSTTQIFSKFCKLIQKYHTKFSASNLWCLSRLEKKLSPIKNLYMVNKLHIFDHIIMPFSSSLIVLQVFLRRRTIKLMTVKKIYLWIDWKWLYCGEIKNAKHVWYWGTKFHMRSFLSALIRAVLFCKSSKSRFFSIRMRPSYFTISRDKLASFWTETKSFWSKIRIK